MNAMISGKRSIALLVDEHSVRSLHYDDPDTIIDRRAEDLPYLLGNASDVEFLGDCSLEEAKARLDHAVDREEARDLLVILLDGENPEEMDEASAEELREIRREAAEELNELLAQPEVLDAVERIFYSVPMPADGDLVGSLACCQHGSVCHKFLQDLLSSQTAIRNVKDAWDRASREVFETIVERDLAESLCVRNGLYRDIVRAVNDLADRKRIMNSAADRQTVLKYFPKSLLNVVFDRFLSELPKVQSSRMDHSSRDRKRSELRATKKFEGESLIDESLRPQNIINAFTVNVEEYFQSSAFVDRILPSQWDTMNSRIVRNTIRLLDVLEEHAVSGTFFILGWTANQHPELVTEILSRGHEIGAHSYWRRLVFSQSPQEFRDDLRKSIECLNAISGIPIDAYRAPSFSITNQSQWALQILTEEGIRFDSSVFPLVHDRYGIPGASPLPHTIEFPESEKLLCEFPPSTYRVWKTGLPVAGGGYFRLFPFRMTRHMLRIINLKDGAPVMFYIHPWELDPQQPRIKTSLRSRFRHYQNLNSTERKLHQLLQHFRFGTLRESWDSYHQYRQPKESLVKVTP